MVPETARTSRSLPAMAAAIATAMAAGCSMAVSNAFVSGLAKGPAARASPHAAQELRGRRTAGSSSACRSLAAGVSVASLAAAVAMRNRTRRLPSRPRGGVLVRQGVPEEFEQTVEEAKAVLFVKANDEKTDMAKETLKDAGVRHYTLELINEVGQPLIDVATSWIDYMEQKTGSSQLPQIHFAGGKAIAGLDNIFAADDDGSLKELSASVGARRK
eukprot:TRINITY_DN42360_c0_g1_i1.p1 TRINITY_DN42360_c0_g1~~TRINITY_DN42360_c0_g1_i1.p1  ORF type:complete len:216 (-),score=44.70 TRINITY_DN42360_c0_g1_i1:70-717(-)